VDFFEKAVDKRCLIDLCLIVDSTNSNRCELTINIIKEIFPNESNINLISEDNFHQNRFQNTKPSVIN